MVHAKTVAGNFLLGTRGIHYDIMKKITCQVGLAIAASLLVLCLPLYTIFWIYPHFTDIITFEKEVNAKQIATHITKMLVIDNTTGTLSRENITDSFAEVLKEARSDFDLTKIKIFSAQGEVLYSTDARDVGAMNTSPYFSDIVAKGNIFSKVIYKDEKTMEEKIANKDVVETYVPLMRNQRFIGAFEIYYDITYSEHSLSKFVAKSRIIILLLSFLILLCILSISLFAVNQRKKRLKAENEIQLLRDKLPSLYSFPLDEENE